MMDMNQDGEEKWLVLVVKDRFSSDGEREGIKNLLMSCFPLKKNEVYYVPRDDNDAFSNYLFVRERDPVEDLRNMLACKREAFEPYPCHMRITDDEFRRMVQGIEDSRKSEEVKYGDIVTIRNGTYSKLNGIVLRESRSSKVEVGLKFCFGTVIESCEPENLVVVGNIFNYLKVLK